MGILILLQPAKALMPFISWKMDVREHYEGLYVLELGKDTSTLTREKQKTTAYNMFFSED